MQNLSCMLQLQYVLELKFKIDEMVLKIRALRKNIGTEIRFGKFPNYKV